MFILIIAFIAFIVAVISLIVYLVQMHRTKKQYLGEDAVNTIAQKAAEKARRHDKIITCDYCGGKIDTSIHTVCPQCGAAYGKDKEWLERHHVDKQAMEANIQKGIEQNKATVQRLNSFHMKKVRVLLICIFSAIVFVAMIVIAATSAHVAELNQSDTIPQDYVKTDYQFKDPVLCDTEDVKIELGDIYCRKETYLKQDSYDYKIEVKITNKTGAEGTATVDISAANGKCLGSAYLYDHVGTEEVVKTVDLRNYSFGEEAIKSLCISEIRFLDNEYNERYTQLDTKTVETTTDYEPAPLTIKGDILLEKNGVTISTYPGEDEDEYYIQFTNTGTNNFKMRTYASIVNNETDRLWIDYTLPAGCQAETNYLYKVYLPEGETLETIQIQQEFKCVDHPEATFVTEYLTLPHENGTIF